jgi:hypothetical protein
MMSVDELKDWLNTLPADALVAIDEGGLSLVEVDGEASIEIGGVEDES